MGFANGRNQLKSRPAQIPIVGWQFLFSIRFIIKFLMTHYLDSELKKVNRLKWLPWIGKRYFDIPAEHRILIVGESHYHDNTTASIDKHDSIIFTREVVDEMAIDRCYYDTKIFQNLHKALFRNDEFDSDKFWNLVSFYNFIQRPMKTNAGRPNYDDFFFAWTTFFELINILKPSICLFLGTSSANFLIDAIEETDCTCEEIKWEDFISNAYAKSVNIKAKDGTKIELVFIRHPSQMFSWNNWNKYLVKKVGKHIAWLENETA